MKINGKQICDEILTELKDHITTSKYTNLILAVICIDATEASKKYISFKRKACEKVGIELIMYDLSSDIITDNEIAKKHITKISNKDVVCGVIIQLPIPDYLSQWELTECIPPEKDVDGLTAISQGKIQKGLGETLYPCTPSGIMTLLQRCGFLDEFKGKRAVVLGRSPLVGKPIANFLLGREANMTVSILHRFSTKKQHRELLDSAHLIVSAAGISELLNINSFSKEPIVPMNEKIIIDVGINFVEKINSKGIKIKKMVGDVSPKLYDLVRAYTPVPGGIGPMTVCMLVRNVIQAYEQIHKIPKDMRISENGFRVAARI